MKLTTTTLKRLVLIEQKKFGAESRLRRQIREHVNVLLEADDAAADKTSKPGSETANTKGTLDIKKIADTLGVDAAKLSSAVKASKSGARSAAHNAILGDVFVKLMEADPTNTVTVMNALKKVSEVPEEEDKK
jgi:hypothetical protein